VFDSRFIATIQLGSSGSGLSARWMVAWAWNWMSVVSNLALTELPSKKIPVFGRPA